VFFAGEEHAIAGRQFDNVKTIAWGFLLRIRRDSECFPVINEHLRNLTE
jgi:hypothetical protein